MKATRPAQGRAHLIPQLVGQFHDSNHIPTSVFPGAPKRHDRESSTAESSQNWHRCRRTGSPGRSSASPEDDSVKCESEYRRRSALAAVADLIVVEGIFGNLEPEILIVLEGVLRVQNLLEGGV